eukprot:13207813-Heterocapsa_arctica.AAC.1
MVYEKGYPQIAETFIEKHGIWDYTFVVQAKAGYVTKILSMNAGVLGKWRRALRQALICTGRLFKPSESARLAGAGGDGWSDTRCVSELYALQKVFGLLGGGVLPASV